MKESTWWSTHVKPRWHNPSKGRVAWKVQDAHNKGFPDVLACFNGVVALIELKYRVGWVRDPDHVYTFSKDKNTGHGYVLSVEQVRHLEVWGEANGDPWVLIGVGKEFFLHHIDSIINDGMTRQQIQEDSIVAGATYDGLLTVPEYFERRHIPPIEDV